MKRMLPKSFSVCLVLVFMFYMLFVPNAFASSKDLSDKKINSNLSEMLYKVALDDVIHVSIWFNDIDHNVIKEKTKEQFEITKSRGSLDTSAIKILDNDIDEKIIDVFRDDTYADDVQNIIEIKRAFSVRTYKIYNQQQKDKIMKTVSLDEESIVYVSSLAPNIEAYLTKDQICELAKSDFITDIYAVDEGYCSINVLGETETRTTSLENDYSEHIYTMTGLNTTRDAFGFTGKNVKIGVFDESCLEETYLEEHYDAVVDVQSYPNATYEYNKNHTYNILSIISGYKENGEELFEGGVPDAEIYIANQYDNYYPYSWKSCVEWLVGVKMCNVINMSRHAEYGEAYNEYGNNAKWIDHIIAVHNVHFVMATGNCPGENYIRDVTLAYNAIAVGSVDKEGDVEPESAYSMWSQGPYKPEVVAPGTNINLPSSNGEVYGTSYAAPLVTCAVAQMCEASAILKYNPSLMKAVIMSGAKRNSDMVHIPLSEVGGTDISLARDCGVGLLYVPNCYTSFVTNGYYMTGTMSPYSTLVTKNVRVNRTGKLFRVVVSWEKLDMLDEENSNTSSTVTTQLLDQFYLTVTTPSGNSYTSFYEYDNKQVVSFITEETGNYTISLSRYSTENSGQIVGYGISCSLVNN